MKVDISGFLPGGESAPGDLMRYSDQGRMLFLGISPGGQVFGHVVALTDPIAVVFNAIATAPPMSAAFIDLETVRQGAADPRQALLASLRDIHGKGWIPSQKRAGVPEPCSARNGSGYTLDAELGISTNG